MPTGVNVGGGDLVCIAARVIRRGASTAAAGIVVNGGAGGNGAAVDSALDTASHTGATLFVDTLGGETQEIAPTHWRLSPNPEWCAADGCEYPNFDVAPGQNRFLFRDEAIEPGILLDPIGTGHWECLRVAGVRPSLL